MMHKCIMVKIGGRKKHVNQAKTHKSNENRWKILEKRG